MEKTNKTMNELIGEYNEAENKAFALLKDIFKQLRNRSGYRNIHFSNGEVLSNCWQHDERLTYKLHLSRFERNITSYEGGIEK